MISPELAAGLWQQAQSLKRHPLSPNEYMQAICRILHEALSDYNWVGFYLVNPQKERELFLGPYVGAPTEHARIPFGKGICGQAAATGETFIIDDVAAETNYLSCSMHVKSEIVVPLFFENGLVGELDIDSHKRGAFDSTDRTFLEKLGEIVAEKVAAARFT